VAGVWERWGGVLTATLLAVPLLVLLVKLRARRLPTALATAEIGAIALTVPWVWMILTPRPDAGTLHPLPFEDVSGYLDSSLGEVVVQIVGNLAVFAAFGALAPIRWRLSLWQVAAIVAVGSITCESLQYLLDLGRVTSTDDVLLNTGGAVLAALLSRRWWRIRA
jgi:glycopeptide antibiotics resistance protein